MGVYTKVATVTAGKKLRWRMHVMLVTPASCRRHDATDVTKAFFEQEAGLRSRLPEEMVLTSKQCA